jgi:hypothetical protein
MLEILIEEEYVILNVVLGQEIWWMKYSGWNTVTRKEMRHQKMKEIGSKRQKPSTK